jgi:hypothetical protein
MKKKVQLINRFALPRQGINQMHVTEANPIPQMGYLLSETLKPN